MKLVSAYIALGANVGRPEEQVRGAFEALAMLRDTRLMAISSLYRTAPVGFADQPDFVNAVAHIETALAPRALLDALLGIELKFGRRREAPNGPRTLDLDLLLYDDIALHETGLTIPHPRMHERAFVMVPLAEIAPDANIPGVGVVSDLVKALDAASATKLEAEP